MLRYPQSESCEKFLDDTRDLRRELQGKRFEYAEAARNPKATAEDLAKREKEIRDLQGKISAKAPQSCWW
jgi:hypothetical protein